MVINNTLRMYWQYQYQYFVLNVLIITIPKLISKILKYFLAILFPIQFEVIAIPAILNKSKRFYWNTKLFLKIFTISLDAEIVIFQNVRSTYCIEYFGENILPPSENNLYTTKIKGNPVFMAVHNFFMWGYRLRDDSSEVMSAKYLSTSSMQISTSNLCLLLENSEKKFVVKSSVSAFDLKFCYQVSFLHAGTYMWLQCRHKPCILDFFSEPVQIKLRVDYSCQLSISVIIHVIRSSSYSSFESINH